MACLCYIKHCDLKPRLLGELRFERSKWWFEYLGGRLERAPDKYGLRPSAFVDKGSHRNSSLAPGIWGAFGLGSGSD